jgi:hypothetical protein
MGNMAIVLIDDKSAWDKFVDESSYGLLSHKWDFLKIAEKYSGYKLHTYGFYKGEELLGIYPLFYKRFNGFKMIFSPPPRRGIPYLGFLVSKEYDRQKQSKKETLLNQFLEEIEAEIKKYSPDYMLIYTVPNFLDMRFFKWNDYLVAPDFTYVVNLNRPAEEIWGNFHKDVRRDIKHAESSGLELKKSTDLSIFHERQERRYREKAANFSMDANYLKDLYNAYPDNINIYYVYNNEGQVASASMAQEYKGRVLGWMGLAKAVGNANEFMIWKLMESSKLKGFDKFEIAGANVRSQCQFKSRFNPSLEVCYHIYKKSLLGKAAEWAYVNLYESLILHRKKVKA